MVLTASLKNTKLYRLMLEYQKQDCDLTLQEGLDCYYNSFPETTEIMEDNKNLEPF